MRQVVDQFQVDGVLDTGDITDWGSEPENRLITSVGTLDVPYVYIRGNHDSAATAALIAAQPNATVLAGTAGDRGGHRRSSASPTPASPRTRAPGTTTPATTCSSRPG